MRISTRVSAMAFQSEKKCPFCAEIVRAAAIICRFCNRAIVSAKPCSFCQESIREEAKKCRFCCLDQPEPKVKVKEHPPVTGIVPSSLTSFGFQTPPYTPVYTPIEPSKTPEQCQAQQEFEQWRKKRTDAITHGDKHE